MPRDPSDDNNCPGSCRSPLSTAEVESIKRQLLESIYADIGKSIVKKFLWVVGTVGIALLTGLSAAGKLKLGS